MADDDMADNEKAVTPEHPHPSTDAPPVARSEWTASDSRGPLGTAGEQRAQAEEAGPTRLAEDNPPVAVEHEPAAEARDGAAVTDSAIGPAMAEPAASTGEPAFTEPPGVTPPPVEEARKRSVWPIAAGLVVGAVIGAGSAAIVDGLWSGSGPSQDPQVASLTARVDALEKRPDPAGLAASVAALDQKVAGLESRAATKPQAPVAAASEAPSPAAVDLAPLRKQVVALQAQIESLKLQGSQTGALDTKIAALEGAVAGMKKDASSAQAGVQDVEGQQKTMATEQKMLADKVMVPGLAVVADSLVQQIDQGQPYAAQVAALGELGADPAKIAILKQNADHGVLSAKALAAKFAPLAEPISATAHKAPPNAGFVDRLKSGMLSMVSVRSVDDTAGTDPASRAAQISTDLAHDDVAGALATWNALPADAKPKGGEDWALLAKAHAEAMAAARALQHDAIVALGTKKS